MWRKYRKTIILCLILSLISSVTLVLSPFYLGEAIDVMIGIGNVDMPVVVYYIGIVAACYSMHFITTWIVSLLANYVAVNYVEVIRERLKNHVEKLPLSYLDTHAHGNLSSLLAMDGEQLLDGIYQGLTQLLNGVFVIIISLGFMLYINIPMTLIVVAMVPVVFLTSRFIAKKSLALFRQQQDYAGQLSGKTAEMISNISLVNTENYRDKGISIFTDINDAMNEVGAKAQFISAITNPTTRVVNNLSYLLIGLSGALVIREWGMSIGLLTSFISYSMMFSKPFNELSGVVSQMVAAKASHQRIMNVLEEPLENDVNLEVELQGQSISFEHVNFGYNPKVPIIQDLNLNIEPLSKVAIVGPTGAGKSTMINLLMRFYDTNQGLIEIDGHDVSHMSRQSARSVMGIVLQDPWLFEGTIRDNIAYGKPDASLEEIMHAAKQAGCHETIISLDKGYDTIVELDSNNLSIGQRQMITIARALLVNAPMIILDEATSSLDIITEQTIQNVFTEIMKNRTSFFIAHRLSTVVDSDIILVMREGRLVEQGNHEELMKKKGFYHELYMSQF